MYQLGERHQWLRGRSWSPRDRPDTDQQEEQGNEGSSRGVGAGSPETLVPVGPQVAVETLAAYQGAPRARAFDLDLLKTASLLWSRPAPYRLVKRHEDDEKDENGPCKQHQEPAGAVHRAEAICRESIPPVSRDATLGR